VLFLEATHLPGTPLRRASAGATRTSRSSSRSSRAPEAFASPHIVIKHFSMKYGERDIADARAALPPALRERVVMLA
jgi:hypothetical protein